MNFDAKFNARAVYWPPGKSLAGGHISYGTPIEIRCFWESNIGETPIQIDKDGTIWTPKSIVSTDVPILEKGHLWRGMFRNLVDKDDPRKNVGSAKIESVSDYPTIDNTQTLFVGYL